MTTDISHAEVHRPAAAFRAHLDEEIGRAFRRDRALPRLRLAAAILVSLAIGMTAGLASAQVRSGAQRDSLLEAAQADAMLVKMRLDLARAQLADARRSAAAGASGPESTASAEDRVRDVETLFARAALNIAEIKETAKAPRDELNAPLVNGRDFMKDRISLQAMAAQRQMQAAEAAQVDVARRVRVGLASELANAESEVAVARARRDLSVLAEQLSLRNEYLAKGTSVDALTRRLGITQWQGDAVVAQKGFELARARVALLEKRRAAGAVSELEVMRASLELKEREIEMQRISIALKVSRGQAQ